MADATCKVKGISKKKKKTKKTGDSVTLETCHKGEKEKQSTKPQTDEYYDRLFRESQLESHLTEQVSDKVDCGEFGNIEDGIFTVRVL